MIKYQIKEGDEEKGREATIIKTGSEIEFTYGNIETDILYLKKIEKELTAQIGVNKATMTNVERTHPHIADMTPEDLTAAYLYREASGFLNMANDKMNEVQKQLTDYAVEQEEILKQTSLDLKEVVLPTNEENKMEEVEKVEEGVPAVEVAEAAETVEEETNA